MFSKSAVIAVMHSARKRHNKNTPGDQVDPGLTQSDRPDDGDTHTATGSTLQTRVRKIFKRLFRSRNVKSSSEGLLLEEDLVEALQNGFVLRRKAQDQNRQLEVNIKALDETIERTAESKLKSEQRLEALEANSSENAQQQLPTARQHLESVSTFARGLEVHKYKQERKLMRSKEREQGIKAKISAALEEAFEHGGALAQVDEVDPTVEFDLQEFLDSAATVLAIPELADEPAPANDPEFQPGPDAGPEPKPEREEEESSQDNDLESVRNDPTEEELLRTYATMKTYARLAEVEFDMRHDVFEEEREENDRAEECGEDFESALALDLRHLQVTQRLTRAVALAEEDLMRAKQAVLAADIAVPGSDLESGFKDDVNDGYRVSLEQEMMDKSVDKPRLRKWLAGIPDFQVGAGDSVPEKLLADEAAFQDWDAASVEIWESVSLVAEGSDRRRIDQWRELASSRNAVSVSAPPALYIAASTDENHAP
ncbi:Hypothetical predicted protein [Lecanosticta acicola]|uniref:Uncharacterized protein n=1 Tax=Lecanosticta acicola TaxID=111012 RepID=A0AAI9E9S0_9PEZI|nr:Hypothetical predicted protein [Lecanosticta acicola]